MGGEKKISINVIDTVSWFFVKIPCLTSLFHCNREQCVKLVLYIVFPVAIETVEVLVTANAVLGYGPLNWSFSTLLQHQGLKESEGIA